MWPAIDLTLQASAKVIDLMTWYLSRNLPMRAFTQGEGPESLKVHKVLSFLKRVDGGRPEGVKTVHIFTGFRRKSQLDREHCSSCSWGNQFAFF